MGKVRWRKLAWWLLGSAVLALFATVGIVGYLVFSSLGRWGEPRMTIMSAPAMTQEFSERVPFDEMPVDNAVDIRQHSTRFGLIGYEVWTRFRLPSQAEFLAFRQRLLRGPHNATDTVMRFDEGSSMPEAMRRLWEKDSMTSGVRVRDSSSGLKVWLLGESNLTVWNQELD